MQKEEMKWVECCNPTCNQRRIHWERPHENRPTVRMQVPVDDKHEKHYCSIECWCYATGKSVREYGTT